MPLRVDITDPDDCAIGRVEAFPVGVGVDEKLVIKFKFSAKLGFGATAKTSH